ncbi:hypothetical protein [Azohydromonas aeria]|uniref:hypothetical protein n=1 Tax=Azohydromonas aeria TaxID=2590212 RepID=UPI0012FA591B|nr:hypothetical protein [Azohydromonas aeria]
MSEASAQPPVRASASQLAPDDQARREYVLEIIGLGVTLDKYRQGKLWEALRQGSPCASISEQDPSLADHASFSGPAVVEGWAGFEKQELFAFEGHETQTSRATWQLMGQLKAIEEERSIPSVLRMPAANLRKLLQRERPDAANEFRILKALKSPNTWVAIPAGHYQFMHPETAGEDHPLRLRQVFDDRYFMASNELNLLNALLLADGEEQDGGD